MQLHEPRIILTLPPEQYSADNLSALCDHVTDAFLIPFFDVEEEETAERIAFVRQSAMRQGTPTTVIAGIPWIEGTQPSGIALALAKGVDWVLASNIFSLEELRRFQGLLHTGSRDVPLMVRIPEKVTPVLAEELLISSNGIWGTPQSLTPSLLQLAHQLGKLTVLEIPDANFLDLPTSHAICQSGAVVKRPIFAPLAADPQVSNDILWSADALRARGGNSKVIVICENLEEVGLAASLSFHHPAILVCRSAHLLRSANIFRGFPAVLDATIGGLEELILSCQERLSALRLVQPGDNLVFVTNNLCSIHYRSI